MTTATLLTVLNETPDAMFLEDLSGRLIDHPHARGWLPTAGQERSDGLHGVCSLTLRMADPPVIIRLPAENRPKSR